MSIRSATFLLTALIGASMVLGGTPSQKLDGSLESRANVAFAKGDYPNALPLLRALKRESLTTRRSSA